MKKYFLIFLPLLFVSFVVNAQQITLEFQNPTITNDGIDDFYEVDVYISSDVSYSQGIGGFLFNYNELAFGSNIATNNNIEYIYDASSIVGSESFGIKNYQQFISNDNLSNRTAFLWQQFWSGGTIGDNITSTPALLLHIKIKMIDVNASPDVCFETNSPFDDQFFTSCGPYGPGLAGADCANETGAQIFDYFPDCSGAVISGTCTGGTITWNGSAWDNGGVPDNTKNVVINGAYNTTTASIDACSLQINSSKSLVITAGSYVKVEEDITVDGTLDIQHEGSLVQVNDLATVTNNNSIVVTKTTPVATANSFSILGSPMSGTTRGGAFVANNVVMFHNTGAFNLDPLVTAVNSGAEHFADKEGDNWGFIAASNGTTQVFPGEGYLVGPTDQGVIDNQYDLTYTEGTLNNGVYSKNLIFNDLGNGDPAENRSNSPNILSNPYASAIDAIEFINMNNEIDAVYFWNHIRTPVPQATYPGYRFENWDMGDISLHNGMMGIAAPNDPGNIPTQFIPSGQGFGVKASAAGTAMFNNSLRVTGSNTGYRAAEIDKLYITVKNETYNLQSSTGIGFTSFTTNDYEVNSDTKRLATPIAIYSVLEEHELAIQGRSTFSTDQIIPLGFRTMVEEVQTYKISLGSIEGDNITQATVYLQDNLLGTLTNLSEDSYTFTSNESNQKDRFVIVFTNEQLGNSEVVFNSIAVYPNPTAAILTINSPFSNITNVAIYDLQGRLIKTINVENKLSFQLDMSSLKTAMYFVRIETNKGIMNTKVLKE